MAKAKPRPQRGTFWRVLRGTGLALLVAVAIVAVTVPTLYYFWGRDLQSVEALKQYKPKQVTGVLDANGERFGEIYSERRSFVALDKMPKHLVDAFVVAEDESFWTHGGVDVYGIARAAVRNVLSGGARQGASTITQQVAKTFFLSPERTLRRKFKEVILARRIEAAMSKAQILTLYLNEIFLGHNRYGVQEASRYYFDKDVADVNVGEAALLAALPKAPAKISPRVNPERAKERQVYVLNQMVRNGKLAADEAKRWIDEPIAVAKDAFPTMGLGPEWVALAKEELLKQVGPEKLDVVGTTVATTMEPKWQRAAEAALRRGLIAYDSRHKIGRPLRKVTPEKLQAEQKKLGAQWKGDAPKVGAALDVLVTAVDDGALQVSVAAGTFAGTIDLSTSDASRFVPRDDKDARQPLSSRFAVNDVVRATFLGEGKFGFGGPQGAIVALDVKTRHVLAMVGGYSLASGGFNRALSAKRQPGSTFKPIVFAAGIAKGTHTPATIVNDAPEVFDLWRPQNYAKEFEGPVRLRYALAKSINTVAIRVCNDVGLDAVLAMAASLGLGSGLPRELSLALGSGEVTPLALTNAYATFAAGGNYADPMLLMRVGDKKRAEPRPLAAVAPAVAYVTLDMMRSVVQEGTGNRASKLGIPLAGKTGTSNDARDAWFVGLTPNVAVGVWIGYDDNQPLGSKETGGTTAVPMFVDVMNQLRPRAAAFVAPEGVVTARIDKVTGRLAAPEAPPESTILESFVAGTVPTEVAPMPGQVDAANAVASEYED